MNDKDLGATTAYGIAKEGGYTGTEEEWYNLFLAIINGELDAPYDTFAERPYINGVLVTGNKNTNDYGLWDIYGGSYFRITGAPDDVIKINGVECGTVGSDGKALIGGIMEVGTTTVQIGNTTKEIETPYFGIYKVSA